MRYISALHLKNFQSYKNQTITFNDGLNLILGSSDSGKSAIMRAISFVLYNYPRSNTLIHNGEDQAEVTIEFSDGLKVTRIKGKRNAYIAIKPDGTEIELDKVDKAVPDEIKKLLNNPPEDDFNGLISYADQFSKMFLVDLSPTDLPRSLSNLTGVEILEDAAKNLMQSYKTIDKQIKLDEKEFEKISNEYHAFDEIYDVEKLIKSTQTKINEIEIAKERVDNLSEFDTDFDDDDLNNSLVKINSLISHTDSAINKIQEIDRMITKLNSLSLFSLMNEEGYSENDIYEIEKLLDNISGQKKSINEIESILNDYSLFHQFEKNYDSIKLEGKSVSEEYSLEQKNYKLLSGEYELFIEDLKQKNIMCDKCGSVLK